MSNYLKIDSTLRSSGSYSDCTIKSRHLITRGRYALKQAFLPVDFYNVNSTNNAIYFNENGIDKVATIVPGFYSGSNIPAAIKAALDTASSGYNTFTVAIGAVSLRVTITASLNVFSLKFGSFKNSSAASLLGYDMTDSSSPALSQLSDSSVNLSPVRSFNISINRVGGMLSTGGATFSFTVPIAGVSGSVQIYEPPVQFPQEIVLPDCYELQCTIQDEKGNNLVLQSDWFLILGLVSPIY